MQNGPTKVSDLSHKSKLSTKVCSVIVAWCHTLKMASHSPAICMLELDIMYVAYHACSPNLKPIMLLLIKLTISVYIEVVLIDYWERLLIFELPFEQPNNSFSAPSEVLPPNSNFIFTQSRYMHHPCTFMREFRRKCLVFHHTAMWETK